VASAGGSAIISYSPLSTAVPTLGGNLLIALAVLLMLIAFRLLKDRQRAGTNLVIAIAAIAALASGAGGFKLVADASAVLPGPLEMTDADGGTVSIPGPGFWEVTNATDVPMKIDSIQFSPGCSDQPPVNGAARDTLNGAVPSSTCTTSTTLAPKAADICTLEVFCGGGT
jgi:hypothetical protein